MEVYEYDSYKKIIQSRIKELKTKNPSFTLKKLSTSIPVQYTYLSKVLNEESVHLNEDHLFRTAKILDFNDRETEYFTLLRSYEAATDPERKLYLKNKLENFKKDRVLDAQFKQSVEARLSEEMRYLFDPFCIVVHMAMHIPEVRKSPIRLCTLLKITEHRLKNILLILERNGFVELRSDDPLRIKKLHEGHIHYGKDHPLMRTHQSLLKAAIPSRLQQVEESDKHSFLATFTLAPADFEKIKTEFQSFTKKVEKIVKDSTEQGVYQINFDLFRWL